LDPKTIITIRRRDRKNAKKHLSKRMQGKVNPLRERKKKRQRERVLRLAAGRE
jgi:hypothetical protein